VAHGEKDALEIIEDIDRRYDLPIFFASWLINYMISESLLSLRSLVFVGLRMGVILSSGQVTTRRH
jgi:hypothetical protein